MIHKQLKPGQAVLKFSTPLADLPKTMPNIAPTYQRGHQLNQYYRLEYFRKEKPTFTHDLHFAVILETRKARVTGDSFPAFMAPFFEALGFTVKPIESPKGFFHKLSDSVQGESLYSLYKNLNAMTNLYGKMPYAYDLSAMYRIQEYVLQNQNDYLNISGRTGFRYIDGQKLFRAAFPSEDFRVLHERSYGSSHEVHMLHEGKIKRKIQLQSYFSNSSFYYDMPQIQVIGARCLLVSPEIYDALETPAPITKFINEKVDDVTLNRIEEFFSTPISLESTENPYARRLLFSTITMDKVLNNQHVTVTDKETFYKGLLHALKTNLTVSSPYAHTQQLDTSNHGTRQPHNIFYGFKRPLMNFFEPTSFRPIHLLEPSI